MLNEITITTRVHFDYGELVVAMLSIFGFSEEKMSTVTGFDLERIKKIRAKLRSKLHADNSQQMAYHAQLAGLNIDGTYEGKDILSDEMKRKVLAIDPDIVFRFPAGNKN